jgi:hypothetical protein
VEPKFLSQVMVAPAPGEDCHDQSNDQRTADAHLLWGMRFLPRGNPVPRNGGTGPSSDGRVPPQPIDERSRRDSRPSPPEQTQLTTAHQEWPKRREADLATLALTIRYKGEERTTKLALTHHAIGQLALEAGLRDKRIGEFISELVSTAIQKNLLHRVLDIS